MSDILVIKCRAGVKPEVLRDLRQCILAEKETGVIVLPSIFDAVVVPDDIKIIVADDIEEESEETL